MQPTSSVNRLQLLVKDVINHEDFDPTDLQGFNAAKELSKLNSFDSELCGLPELAEWRKTTVEIPLPATQHQEEEVQAFRFVVENVRKQYLSTFFFTFNFCTYLGSNP
jgi:hypothetical protein